MRLKIKKKIVGQQIKINPSFTLIFSEYMSDAYYQYAIKNYPRYFEKPKKTKKNDND
tara:strand:+ start:270 stop:440 length:171 start_codon:yes stop_codon:yes gene_type:complete